MAHQAQGGAYGAHQAQEGAHTAHQAQESVQTGQPQQQSRSEEYARQNELAQQAHLAQQAQWQNTAAPMAQKSANYVGVIQNTLVAAQQAPKFQCSFNRQWQQDFIKSGTLRTLGIPLGNGHAARQNFIPPWRSTFSGSSDDDLISYISQFEHYVHAYGLMNNDAAATLVASLRGRAASIAAKLPPGSYYEDIVAILQESCSEASSAPTSAAEDDSHGESIRWVNHALESVVHDDNGEFEEEAVMLVLQATATKKDSKSGSAGPCYFCKLKGHSWRKCFKLRNILRENGMKGNGPFPRDAAAFAKRKEVQEGEKSQSN